jgi:hypothetical protein
VNRTERNLPRKSFAAAVDPPTFIDVRPARMRISSSVPCSVSSFAPPSSRSSRTTTFRLDARTEDSVENRAAASSNDDFPDPLSPTTTVVVGAGRNSAAS